MMRGLPFWLSMLVLVLLWIIFSLVIARCAPTLRMQSVKRAIYALLCALASVALLAAVMKAIIVFFN